MVACRENLSEAVTEGGQVIQALKDHESTVEQVCVFNAAPTLAVRSLSTHIFSRSFVVAGP